MAIPFFKWTLAGDLFYGALFIAIIEASSVVSRKLQLGETTQNGFHS